MRSAWFVIQAKRYSEARVHVHLLRQGIPAFLPLIEVTRRHRRGRVRLLEPLFPGYLFSRLDASQPQTWQAVIWSPGVRRVLGTAEVPVAVPDEVVERIQDHVKELGFVRPGVRFSAGSSVRIRGGPLAGLEAIFAGPLSRQGRVRILVQLLGGSRDLEIDEADLDPV